MKILEDKGYVYKKHLSTGGEGEVHLIKSVDKHFVAKIFPKLSDDSIGILKAIKSLNISGIPKIHDIFDFEDKTIVIRDFVEGTTLYDEIKKNEFLSFKRAKAIILKICKVLRALHIAKPKPIIYRDLKPENIIVTPEGNIYLIDFGIARYYKKESTRDTVLAGTKGYTAPEVMAGMQSDQRSDVYSAGLLFYEMLTGKNLLKPPFQIRPVKESNEYLPEWLDAVIEKATDLNQTNRHKSINEFMDAIENHVIIQKNHVENKSTQAHKNLLLFKIVAGVIALVVLGGAFYYFKDTIFNNDKYEMILKLGFNREDDIKYIADYQNNDGRFEIKEGMLYVLGGGDGCHLKYLPKNNMVVHFRIKTTNPGGAVGIGQMIVEPTYEFRINPSQEFESLYYGSNNGGEEDGMMTGNLRMDGSAIINQEQWLDYVLYVNEDNTAVYAIICDNENDKIAYTAYQIPKDAVKSNYSIVLFPFFDRADEYMILDDINIAEGSINQYLKENMSAYKKHEKRMNDFFDVQISDLPEMVFFPMSEWQ